MTGTGLYGRRFEAIFKNEICKQNKKRTWETATRMDLTVDCDSIALGSLFQQIILDMKNASPLWEDFVTKANKFHTCLKAVIQAISSYLDAFQKIADAATKSRGASKEIGTALTRVCLRHKAVESRMKTFTSAIMDSLIIPLQGKIEDWKRQVAAIEKEHTKEYKRCHSELKKRSNNTLRLQKKARKNQSETIQSLVDSNIYDVSLRRAELEELERKSLRAAMIEERIRFCTFVNMLQPVVKEECEVIFELDHLKEAMESIATVTRDPKSLPQTSEEIIQETKPSARLYPESPNGRSSSLGSRKSSICSLSSVNSNGSSGSPGHDHYQRSLSQSISPPMQLNPGESSDSGFCSSPILTTQSSVTTSQSHAISTWPPHSQDIAQATDRPHTISSTYEKGHQRPGLTIYTFQKPETIIESQQSPSFISCRPPLPVRCSSLEKPPLSTSMRNSNVNYNQRQCPSPIPSHIAKELPQFLPTYANMSELTLLSSLQNTSYQTQLLPQQSRKQLNSPNQSTTSSQFSSESSMEIFRQLHSYSNLSISAMTPHSAMSSMLVESKIPSSSENIASNKSETIHSNNSCDKSYINVHGRETYESITKESKGQLEITETDIISTDESQILCGNEDILSPENDDISSASVQQKASLFEKLERERANNNSPSTSASRSSILDNNVNKKEDIYKTLGCKERDTEKMYEVSINELNNLIGELDSFQREHDQRQTEKSKQNNSLQNAFSGDSITDEIATKKFRPLLFDFNPNGSDLDNTNLDTSQSTNEYMINLKMASKLTNSDKIECENASSECTTNSVDLTICNQILNDSCDIKYLKENSAVVVLRSKASRNLDDVEKSVSSSSQRLSSFRCEHMNSGPSCIEDGPLIKGCATRMTRRSSSNSIKPQPPVRRSSSVTPSYDSQRSTSSTTDSPIYISTESLPPPPSFLLDHARNDPLPVNVAQTVKALTVIKHTPASPTVLRRGQSEQKHLQATGEQRCNPSNAPFVGVYAQTKQINKLSSFRSSSSASQKSGSTIIAHINAKLLPHKTSHLLQHSHATCKSNVYQQSEVYQEVLSNHHQSSFKQSAEQQTFSYAGDTKKTIYWRDSSHRTNDCFASNAEKAGNMRNKSRAEFPQNLNVKLAKQGLSGRASTVRNIINSKALPDPRICHESLMDQIKRGAILKRNRTINDRSAPKIR